jgi:hypothetical protein
MYYQEFRKEEYCELDKNLFIRKPMKRRAIKGNQKDDEFMLTAGQ